MDSMRWARLFLTVGAPATGQVGGIQVKSRGKAKDGPSNKEPAGKKQKKKAQTGTSVEEHESVEAEPMDVVGHMLESATELERL